MRLTIRINESGSATHQPSFAVLWVDTDEQLWSREAHQGIDLPRWGKVKHMEGVVALCAADGGEALCRLQGLSFDALVGAPSSGAGGHGAADLGSRHGTPGAWHLQAVERCTTQAENAGFLTVP